MSPVLCRVLKEIIPHLSINQFSKCEVGDDEHLF